MENNNLELREGRIVVFKNIKQKESQPDFRGKCKIENIIYKVSLWVGKKDDKLYLSGELSIPLDGESLSDEEINNEFENML